MFLLEMNKDVAGFIFFLKSERYSEEEKVVHCVIFLPRRPKEREREREDMSE